MQYLAGEKQKQIKELKLVIIGIRRVGSGEPRLLRRKKKIDIFLISVIGNGNEDVSKA